MCFGSKKANSAALTVGIIWGVWMFIATLLNVQTGYGTSFLQVMGSLYPGYSVGIVGSFIGLIWGFIDGAFTAGITMKLYKWSKGVFS